MSDITALSPVTPEMLASLKLSAMNLAEGEMMSFEPAVFLVLVEALEARDKLIVDSESRVRQQNRHVCELFDENAALRQRIASLESRTVTVKSLTPEVRNALKAEGLADVLKDAAEYAPLTAGQWETLTKNWHQTFIGLSGAAAGIQVIEGEGQHGGNCE